MSLVEEIGHIAPYSGEREKNFEREGTKPKFMKINLMVFFFKIGRLELGALQ
jgi:hypothetical protein